MRHNPFLTTTDPRNPFISKDFNKWYSDDTSECIKGTLELKIMELKDYVVVPTSVSYGSTEDNPTIEGYLIPKEKENKSMDNNSRNLMNKLKKGQYVSIANTDLNGFIEAFDYAHFRVGVRLEDTPSYKPLSWQNPENLTVATPPKDKPTGKYPMPKSVWYDEEAGVTVVMWDDGDKTIVRVAEGDYQDVYNAFCAAYCKKVYGSNSALKRELNKIITYKVDKIKNNETAIERANRLISSALKNIDYMNHIPD